MTEPTATSIGPRGDGFLDLHETDERVTAAYAARHRCELEPLVADLPQHGAP